MTTLEIIKPYLWRPSILLSSNIFNFFFLNEMIVSDWSFYFNFGHFVICWAVIFYSLFSHVYYISMLEPLFSFRLIVVSYQASSMPLQSYFADGKHSFQWHLLLYNHFFQHNYCVWYWHYFISMIDQFCQIP